MRSLPGLRTALAVWLVAAGVPAFADSALAQSCAPQASTSRPALGPGAIPPEMLEILRTLRLDNNGVCKRTGAFNLGAPSVDPGAVQTPAELSDLTQSPFVPDEVIALVPGDGSNITEIADSADLGVLSQRRSDLLDAFLVRFLILDGRNVSQVTLELANDDRVDTVSPQHIFDLQAGDVESSRFAPQKILLQEVGGAYTGKSIRVAVIDTAVDENHPSLQDAIEATFDAMPDKSTIDRSHGTSISGLIAGRRSVRGVAPDAQLLIARVFDDFGRGKSSGTASHLIDALDWAVEQNANVINMSFAGPRNGVFSKALAAAAGRGITLVAAAGNNGPRAPAAYPAAEPSVLAVTATDVDDRIYSNANAGDYVFIAAPGVDVVVPTPGGSVDVVQGTSFAGAFVTGIVALLLQKEPRRSPGDVARDLSQAARDLGAPGRDHTFGVGLANAALTLGGTRSVSHK